MNKQNHYVELFNQMLNQMDMGLIKHGKNAYHVESAFYILSDENEIIQTTQELFDRLELFIDESFADDLSREAIDYGLLDYISHPWDAALEKIEQYRNGTVKEREFVKDHEWEIEVLDMLCHHLDEVNINSLDCHQSDEKVYYIRVTETYQKIVRVIGKDSCDAADKAYEALNCGEIECTEYKDDSTNVETLEAEWIESMWGDDVSEVTLIDDKGEVKQI